jgi:hypothetical protein
MGMAARLWLFLTAFIWVFALTGCAGNSPPAPQYNPYESAAHQFKAATAVCHQKYAIKTIEAVRPNFQCIIDAENNILRPLHPYPDLLDKKQITRMVLVTKLERRQVSPQDAALELAKSDSDAAAELHRRLNADRAVRAQEAAAIGILTERTGPDMRLTPMVAPQMR